MAAVASPAQTLTRLYNVTGGTDGAGPAAPLVQGSDGNFYGTTSGTIFQITPQGTLSTLHTFNGTDDSQPSGVIQATDGRFYGTAGSLFSIVPGGSLVIIDATANSHNPIIQAGGGNLYGATSGAEAAIMAPSFQQPLQAR